jgi:hypothetical protein
LDGHPPIRTIQNVLCPELHPRAREAPCLLIADAARGQDLDDGCGLVTAVQDDVGDHAPRETDLRSGVGNVVGKILHDSALAVEARAGPRHARSWAGRRLPLLDDSEQLCLGGTVKCALTRATFAAAVGKVRTPQLAATKYDISSAAGAAVCLVRHRVVGPDVRTVGGDGHRNCDRGVRHGMNR